MAGGGDNGRVVRLTAERLQRLERRVAAVEEAQRGTNARLDATNERLDQAVDILTRLVRVVAAQNDRMNRNFAALGQRIDRLSKAIMAGRTSDLRRLAAAERRLEALERRLG
jgi:hypothetical protein